MSATAEHTAAADHPRAAEDPGLIGTVGNLAGDAGRLAGAWIELARAEMAVAKLSAVRLAMSVAGMIVLGFATWLFACLALGFWMAGVFGRTDVAMAAVAGLNVLIIVGLVLAMRRWWQAMQMPDSRKALGEIARTLS